MIERVPREQCTGCRACESICPQKAISMVVGGDGFWYPTVNEQCVSCGLCLKVCQVEQAATENEAILSVVAAQNKDESLLKGSSSGGVFCELAKAVLEDGGVVFGAAMTESLAVSHSFVETISDLPKLMGSKYVQSDIGESFRLAKTFLEEKRTVLFSGTPCQIRGLHLFLNKPYDNLITVDLVCHGVPSQKAFEKYLSEQRARIEMVNFRHKQYGWRDFSVCLVTDKKKSHIRKVRNDLYMRAFLKNLNLRRSCYRCPANRHRSGSDITLGDFWNIEKLSETFPKDRGVSGVILRTEKGKKIFERIKNIFLYEERMLEEMVRYNHVITSSVAEPPERTDYLQKLEKTTYERADDVFVCSSLTERIKKRLKRIKR